jgi:hypothetical protein
MIVRPFHWRDLSALNRYRKQSVFLDAALVLTHGEKVISDSLASILSRETGIVTVVLCNEDEQQSDSISSSSRPPNSVKGISQPAKSPQTPDIVFGQFRQRKGSPFAQLSFLTPENAIDSPMMVNFLDDLVCLAGECGAYHLLAEVDEAAHIFESLRHAGFAIYSRQRIWKLPVRAQSAAQLQKASQGGKNLTWRIARSKDVIAIRTLYNNLVPGMVQQVEPFLTLQRPNGLVFEPDGELKAFVEVKYGRRGIWAQPFFHPNVEDITGHLTAMLAQLANGHTRPIYVCVRSYQFWMEPALEAINAEVSYRQAVMAKHMAAPIKVLRPVTVTALEGGSP